MKTVVLFIPKDRRKATLHSYFDERPKFGVRRLQPTAYEAYIEAVGVLKKSGVDYENKFAKDPGKWWLESVKISRRDVPRAMAVLRFAGFTLIADEKNLKGQNDN